MGDNQIPHFVSSNQALEVVTKATGSQVYAILALTNALRLGKLEGWGVAPPPASGSLSVSSGGGAPIPAEFWNRASDYDTTRWLWREGVFRVSTSLGQHGETLEYSEVAFSTLDVIEVCEAAAVDDSLDSLPADVGKDSPQTDASRKGVGGRSAGKAGYAHAAFIVAMQCMSDLASEKVDVLATLLAEEYVKIGLKQPAQENLKTWVSSMRRALLGQSPEQ